MPLFELIAHPDHMPQAVERVTVHLEGSTSTDLWVNYEVRDARTLVHPPDASPTRTDGLWRTTCFELFLKSAGGDAYNEFNFSPSGAWAAYGFDSYRAGMRELPVSPPDLDIGPAGRKRFYLLADLRSTATAADMQIGLSAVIEEQDGSKSFWALAHPPGAPDFHHPACFAARLPAPERA